MAMSSQWDKCHKIDMNSSKKQLLYIWSLVASTPEGTPLMQTSWWEHRGACAGCRSVESHLFMEGGFVCEWQVASCSEGSPSAKHVRTHIRVKHWLCRISKMDGAAPAALNKLLTFWIADISRESPLPCPRMIIFGCLWYLGHGFAGPVHSIDVLKGDDGIHLQATVDHKDLAHGLRRFQLQLIAPKGPWNTQTLAPLAQSESSLIQNETCLVKWNQDSWLVLTTLTAKIGLNLI